MLNIDVLLCWVCTATAATVPLSPPHAGALVPPRVPVSAAAAVHRPVQPSGIAAPQPFKRGWRLQDECWIITILSPCMLAPIAWDRDSDRPTGNSVAAETKGGWCYVGCQALKNKKKQPCVRIKGSSPCGEFRQPEGFTGCWNERESPCFVAT